MQNLGVLNDRSTPRPPVDAHANVGFALLAALLTPEELLAQPAQRSIDWFSLPLLLPLLALVTGLLLLGFLRSSRRDAEDSASTTPAAPPDPLGEMSSLYRALFDSATDGIVILDDGLFVDCNRAMTGILGLKREEIIGHGPDEFSPPSQPDGTSSKESSSLRMGRAKAGMTQVFEWVHSRPDGSLVEAEVSLTGILTGKRSMQLAVVREIGERKAIEAALHASEERYRTLVDRLPDGIYRSTHEGRFLQVNPAMARILGYDSPEELLQIDIKSDLYPDPADRDAYVPILEETGVAIGRLRRKDGSIIWVEDHGTFTYDENGEVVQHEGILRDVSERLETEAALDQLLELERLVAELSSAFVDVRPQELTLQIDAALERIGVTFDLNRVGLWKIDQDNAQAHLLSIWAPEGAGVPSSLALDEVPGALSSVMTRQVFMFSSLDNATEIAPAEAEFFRRIGTKSHLSVPLLVGDMLYGSLSAGTTHAERDWSPDFVRAMRVTGEILASAMARAQAEEQVQASRERLRALASELSRVEERERRRIATYLHDQIGQSLAVMRLKLGALAKSISSADGEESIDQVRDLLETTIEDTQTATFDLSPPVLYELGLGAAIEWIGEKMGREHGFRFELEASEPDLPINVDEAALLFRAVRELMMNVVKHARAERVTAKLETLEATVQVTIEDDGRGFDESVVDEPRDVARFGLFSIRERMAYLGGRLEIDSRPGHGTRVILVAPVATRRESAKEGT